MRAHVEAITCPAWIMRISGDDWVFGQPYDLALVVLDLGNGECELSGVDLPITTEIFRAIQRTVAEMGFDWAVVRRYRLNGSSYVRRHRCRGAKWLTRKLESH